MQRTSNKIPTFKAFVLQNFPFIASDKDALELSQRVDYLVRYVDYMSVFINDILESKIVDYINVKFNDIMIDAMYDSANETLILSMDHEGSNE